nr:hypothetical protein [Tanacetum cinerariifolium]
MLATRGNGKVTTMEAQANKTKGIRNQRTRTCYECGSLRHYKSECPIVKFQKHVDMIHGGVRASKPKTMQDEIKITTKLMNKKINTLAEHQAKNKKKLDNTSKNNQNQQQPNKRQNTSRAYTENSTNEAGCEMTVTIRDGRYWHAMSGDYFFDVQSCESFHTICCSGEDEMSGFGKAVDNDPDCVMSV